MLTQPPSLCLLLPFQEIPITFLLRIGPPSPFPWLVALTLADITSATDTRALLCLCASSLAHPGQANQQVSELGGTSPSPSSEA